MNENLNTKTRGTFFAMAFAVALTVTLMLIPAGKHAPASEKYEVSLNSPTSFPIDI